MRGQHSPDLFGPRSWRSSRSRAIDEQTVTPWRPWKPYGGKIIKQFRKLGRYESVHEPLLLVLSGVGILADFEAFGCFAKSSARHAVERSCEGSRWVQQLLKADEHLANLRHVAKRLDCVLDAVVLQFEQVR